MLDKIGTISRASGARFEQLHLARVLPLLHEQFTEAAAWLSRPDAALKEEGREEGCFDVCTQICGTYTSIIQSLKDDGQLLTLLPFVSSLVEAAVKVYQLGVALTAEVAAKGSSTPTDGLSLNRAGAAVATRHGFSSRSVYCCRHLGKDAIPGSDGTCGPTDGPQCSDCRPMAHASRNNAGAIVSWGRDDDFKDRLYCSRQLGAAAIPGADGRRPQHCRNAHALTTQTRKLYCDGCDSPTTAAYGCRTCNFDLCPACFAEDKGVAPGQCGPDRGPQCNDCKALPTLEACEAKRVFSLAIDKATMCAAGMVG
jgi:hypothetical protein